MKILLTSVAFVGLMTTQYPATGQTQVITLDKQPLYKVTVVSRSVKAVNYRHRSGVTKVDFQGTALMPRAHGDAKVNSKQGYLEVNAHFKDFGPASQFGPEYLTYVLWAITPEGRAKNLGEILLNDENDSKLDVTTDLQAFGLIVTAEPHFAVTLPSNVVVMENIVRSDTRGATEDIDAKFELLERGQYTYNVNKSLIHPMDMRDRNVPIELYEARNAVQIARWTGADRYAADTLAKAQGLLTQAEGYQARNIKKSTSMMARDAAQTAEDARLITIKRMEQERLDMERQASLNRENQSRQQAEDAARMRAQAEEQQRKAEAQQKLEAERASLEAQKAQLAQQQAMTAQQQAEAERQAADRARAEALATQQQAAQAADRAKAEALVAQQQAAKERAEADAARQAALLQQQAAQQDIERARQAAAESDRMRMKAETDKEALRQQLLQQFNMILETRDSARGLIVNMSDVLFDTGKYTLRPGAREKLAKVSGIILAHPGLKLEVEGHTDSVGGDAYNQTLSENRANAVRQYLINEGLNGGNVTAKGFGKTMPVASNDTAAGRQQNRRVELVVSGEIIGTKVSEIHTMQVQH
jgi:outer membrane protein OmpA-like peptidoglycan-associated protein